MARDNNSKESILEALGSPVLASFPEELRLTKRNLLLVAAVIIFVKMSGMKIGEENVSLLGISFSNPGQRWIDLMLLGTILYLSAQFLWQTVDYARQTRLRITGTKLTWVTGPRYSSPDADYPDDPAQSSLHYWWANEAQKIGKLSASVEAVQDAVRSVKQAAKPFEPPSTAHMIDCPPSAPMAQI